MYLPRNTLVPLAREVKKACPDATVIGTGSITVPEEAEEFIASGTCDMVALGRTLLADAHWPNKAKAGKRIVPCIRCNVCYHQLWLAGPLWCAVNPYVLHEAEQDIERGLPQWQVRVEFFSHIKSPSDMSVTDILSDNVRHVKWTKTLNRGHPPQLIIVHIRWFT